MLCKSSNPSFLTSIESFNHFSNYIKYSEGHPQAAQRPGAQAQAQQPLGPLPQCVGQEANRGSPAQGIAPDEEHLRQHRRSSTDFHMLALKLGILSNFRQNFVKFQQNLHNFLHPR